MKTKLNYLIFITFIVSSFTLHGCGNDAMELEGKIHSADSNGLKCWYITNRANGFNYEIVTPDEFLLQEGRSVKMTVKASKAETICKVGDRVEVVSYILVN